MKEEEKQASGDKKNGSYTDGTIETEDSSMQPSSPTPQELVRLSCLRVLHQLAASTTCAEAMAATSVGTPQVCVYLQCFSLILFSLLMLWSCGQWN